MNTIDEALDYLHTLTLQSAIELHSTNQSDTYKTICDMMQQYSQDGKATWGLDTLQFYFYDKHFDYLPF